MLVNVGMLAGPNTPHQAPVEKPGKPDSAIVARSGRWGSGIGTPVLGAHLATKRNPAKDAKAARQPHANISKRRIRVAGC
jgi:hypothetical protein